MKVFLYRCPNCDAEIDDSSPAASLTCTCKGKDSPQLERVYAFGSVSFKGPGFYKTDK